MFGRSLAKVRRRAASCGRTCASNAAGRRASLNLSSACGRLPGGRAVGTSGQRCRTGGRRRGRARARMTSSNCAPSPRMRSPVDSCMCTVRPAVRVQEKQPSDRWRQKDRAGTRSCASGPHRRSKRTAAEADRRITRELSGPGGRTAQLDATGCGLFCGIELLSQSVLHRGHPAGGRGRSAEAKHSGMGRSKGFTRRQGLASVGAHQASFGASAGAVWAVRSAAALARFSVRSPMPKPIWTAGNGRAGAARCREGQDCPPVSHQTATCIRKK